MRKQFETSCNWYLRWFCKKHDLQYAGAYWVGDNVGGVVEVGDYFIDFGDIMYDIDNDVPSEQFFAWKDYDERLRSIELDFYLLRIDLKLHHLNYKSWCKGVPKPYTDSQLGEMEKAVDVLKRYAV